MSSPVSASAPTRVDLAGGTLDLWPLSQLVERAVTVNLAVTVRTGCTITPGTPRWELTGRAASGDVSHVLDALPSRPERAVPARVQLAAVAAAHFGLPPCRIETWSEASPGSGLGGSSSLLIGLVAACARLAGRTLDDAEAVALACNLETRVLGLPGGSQDHWAAQCGGLSILEFGAEGTRRRAVDPRVAGVLAHGLVVADTRVEHHSGMNNWSVLKAVLEQDTRAVEALEGVARAARGLAGVLLAGGDRSDEHLLAAVGASVRDEWAARRRLAPAVTAPAVDRLVAAAEAAGGAAKVCGAGGGGCVVAIAPSPGARAALAEALEAAGGEVLDATAAPEGVRISPPGP